MAVIVLGIACCIKTDQDTEGELAKIFKVYPVALCPPARTSVLKASQHHNMSPAGDEVFKQMRDRLHPNHEFTA